MEKVILLCGAEPVRKYFNVTDRSRETVELLLESIDVYEFDTEAEAEAFRMGLCAGHSAEAKDVSELTEQGYKTLLKMQRAGDYVKDHRPTKQLEAFA